MREFNQRLGDYPPIKQGGDAAHPRLALLIVYNTKPAKRFFNGAISPYSFSFVQCPLRNRTKLIAKRTAWSQKVPSQAPISPIPKG